MDLKNKFSKKKIAILLILFVTEYFLWILGDHQVSNSWINLVYQQLSKDSYLIAFIVTCLISTLLLVPFNHLLDSKINSETIKTLFAYLLGRYHGLVLVFFFEVSKIHVNRMWSSFLMLSLGSFCLVDGPFALFITFTPNKSEPR